MRPTVNSSLCEKRHHACFTLAPIPESLPLRNRGTLHTWSQLGWVCDSSQCGIACSVRSICNSYYYPIPESLSHPSVSVSVSFAVLFCILASNPDSLNHDLISTWLRGSLKGHLHTLDSIGLPRFEPWMRRLRRISRSRTRRGL